MAKSDLTASRLRELLHYDPTSGVFTRKVRTSNRIKVGDSAGWKNGVGYIMVCVDGRQHLTHRLAWLYVYGHWPAHEIDHINRDRADNRIVNLRDITHAQNMQNEHNPRCTNRVGCRGVDWYKTSYRVRLKEGGVLKYSCTGFVSLEAAKAAYLDAKRHFHPFASIPSDPPIELESKPK